MRKARQPLLPSAHPAAHAARIEPILEGTEPDGLLLEKLYRLPAEWEAQRLTVANGLLAAPAMTG